MFNGPKRPGTVEQFYTQLYRWVKDTQGVFNTLLLTFKTVLVVSILFLTITVSIANNLILHGTAASSHSSTALKYQEPLQVTKYTQMQS